METCGKEINQTTQSTTTTTVIESLNNSTSIVKSCSAVNDSDEGNRFSEEAQWLKDMCQIQHQNGTTSLSSSKTAGDAAAAAAAASSVCLESSATFWETVSGCDDAPNCLCTKGTTAYEKV
jgi:hypothetical protein